MSAPFSITALEQTDAELVRRFLQAQYGPGYYGAEPRYFRWLYLEAPCRWFRPFADRDRMPANAILDADGTILALHAYVPFDVRAPWNGVRGVWDLEWINGSGLRGAGRALARRLLDACDLYVGYGCNELSETAFRSMGLTVVPEIHRRVALLDRDGLAAAMAAAGYKVVPPPAIARHRAPDWRLLPSTAAIPGVVLDEQAAFAPFAAMRSPDWLAWRYDRHPHITYQIVAADPDGCGGVAVVRVEAVAGATCRACRIVECFPMPGREWKLFAAVLEFAAEAGCLLADWFTTSADVARRLDTALDGLGLLTNPRLPYMFQPLAMVERNSINLVIAAGPSAPNGVDLDAFHATKGDANQDILRNPASAAQRPPQPPGKESR